MPNGGHIFNAHAGRVHFFNVRALEENQNREEAEEKNDEVNEPIKEFKDQNLIDAITDLISY